MGTSQATRAAVLRFDLNGYSNWVKNRTLRDRVDLLDEFFTFVVPIAQELNGYYFRDEGDCVVVLFADSLSSWTVADLDRYSKAVVQRSFNSLTVKACISIGTVALFQKAHEVRSGDWSAEGQPFVRATRLEQAVPSDQSIFYYFDEFPISETPLAQKGQTSYWRIGSVNLQVPGLSFPGGWAEIVRLDFDPTGFIHTGFSPP